MRKGYGIATACAVAGLGLWAGNAEAAIAIQTVSVGNVNNTADTAAHSGNPAGQGAVNYAYNIGKYEVTAGQYTAFLNAVAKTDTYGLYNAVMDSDDIGCQITRHSTSGSFSYDFSGRPSGTEADWVNRPVNYVSFWDACRFANWLHNGQPIGLQGNSTTEDGAYTLTANGITNNTITRNPGAQWAVTSEDEWYKAAYHDKTAATYFDYPTGTNSVPSNVLGIPTDPGNNATFHNNGYTIGNPYYRTEVGAHENSESPYGTFDQGGNVWEWNEVIYGSDRGLRGGSYSNGDIGLQSTYRSSFYPTYVGSEYSLVGFRVAQVPEPSSLGILGLGVVGMLSKRRRASM
ncbi:MAG: SUMF1/EgtB/PvdO family nonheme iron enzyme [Planctomycetales bacterium]|nr:SUMF1/EgtB/PvdO family nonheme iron enzyme [Planctomycetales bacterium]